MENTQKISLHSNVVEVPKTAPSQTFPTDLMFKSKLKSLQTVYFLLVPLCPQQ